MRMISTQMVEFSGACGVDPGSPGATVPGNAAALALGFGRIMPGGQTAAHRHDRAEAFVVVRGSGEIIVDSIAHRVKAGAVLLVARRLRCAQHRRAPRS